jgi:hypothetical protein
MVKYEATEWRDVRVAEGARLEIVCTLIPYRGFKSHSLRHIVFLQPGNGPSQQVDVNPVRSGRKQR